MALGHETEVASSAFRPLRGRWHRYKKKGEAASGRQLAALRDDWKDIRYLIIDEKSMVGHLGLPLIDKRLRKIFSHRNACFGGLSVSSAEVLINYLCSVICLCIAQISKRVNWTEFLSIIRIEAGLFSRRRLSTLFPPPHPPPDPSPRFRKPPWRCRCLPADVGRRRSDEVERGDGRTG